MINNTLLYYKLIKNLSAVGSVLNLYKSSGRIFTAIDAFKGLTIEQQKLFLSTKMLNQEQKEQILMLAATGKSAEGLAATTAGLTVEEGKNIIATSANSNAKKEATASTFSLSAAFKGLAASIGISTLALSLIK